MKNIKSDVDGIEYDVKNVKNDVTNVKNDATNVKNDVTNVINDVKNVKEYIETVDCKVDELKDDVYGNKIDIGLLKEQMGSIQHNPTPSPKCEGTKYFDEIIMISLYLC